MFTEHYSKIRQSIFNMIYPAINSYKPTDPDFVNLHYDFYHSNNALKKLNIFYNSAGNIYHGPIPNIESRTPGQEYIDAVIITDNPNKLHDSSRVYIIKVGGNNSCYEMETAEMLMLGKEKYIVICFNPMGVGYSTGVTNGPEDYMRALETVINNLLNNGIPSPNIILKARSFGAAIATRVAEKYQTNNQRIKLINDRSFAELATTAATLIYNQISNRLFRITFGLLLYLLVSLIIRILRLNINPAKSFTFINNKNPGDAICIYVEQDEIIPTNCRMDKNISAAMAKLYCKRFYSTLDSAHNVSLDSLYANDQPLHAGASDTAEEYIQDCIRKFEQDALIPSVELVTDEPYVKRILHYFGIRSNSLPIQTESQNQTRTTMGMLNRRLLK